MLGAQSSERNPWIQPKSNTEICVCRFPNRSNLIEQFFSRTQSQTIQWIASSCSVNKFAWTNDSEITLRGLENTKNTCYTEIIRASKNLLLIFMFSTPVWQKDQEFGNQKFDLVSFFNCFLCEFDLGPNYMVSATWDNPFPDATFSSVYMWKCGFCRPSQS